MPKEKSATRSRKRVAGQLVQKGYREHPTLRPTPEQMADAESQRAFAYINEAGALVYRRE